MTPAEMLEKRAALTVETRGLFDLGDDDHEVEIDRNLTDMCALDRQILTGPSGDTAFFAAQLRLAILLWDEGCPKPPAELRSLFTRLAAIVDGDWSGVEPAPGRIAA